MKENLAEILDRVAAAAKWQQERSERASKEAQQAHNGTGDFAEASDGVRAWFEGHACGVNGARRDAAAILDSIAVALAEVLGTEVPDADEAQERLVAKARAEIAATS